MKLSKNHVVKVAQEVEKESDETGAELNGSDVKDESDDESLEMAADDESSENEESGLSADTEAQKQLKFDARREAATPHAQAIKDLFAQRRELMSQVNALDTKMDKHRQVLQALDPMAKHEAYADDKELRKWLRPEKTLDDGKKKNKKKKLDKKSEQLVVEGLLKVAYVLDYAGDVEGVSLVENMLQIFAGKNEPAKYDVDTVEKKKREYPEVMSYAPALSTRHCPDHNGSMMQRVGEGSFQCNLDGKIYNWNAGFKNYAGDVFPGASIHSIDFPETSERLFETREMATNKRTK